MSKENVKANETVKAKTLTATVISDVLIIGTKNPKKYKKGEEFSTENEALFSSLINRKKIK